MSAGAGLLQGKVAVITGAGRGIGRAVARAFAAEGARIVVNDLGCARDGSGADPEVARAVVEEITAAGGQAVPNADSVTTADGATRIVQQALDTWGRIDILVNNAGILQDKSLLGLTEAMWEDTVAVHLRGTFLCTQAAAQQMRLARRGGRIINTTSVSGMLGNLGQANESAAKAGVYGLTRTASIELQKYDITVNAVAPIAKTRLTEDLPMFEKVTGTLEPEHVAPVYVFLASELGREVSGSVFSVAGGRLSTYQLVESAGRLKEADGGIWTPAEIAEHLESISKL
jgi:NAD(P)-dependent dehydrogenase (short-subunit alcohol dehydrogenase family)